MQATALFDERMRIGESIVWDDRGQALFWVDVGYPSYVYRFDMPRQSADRIEYDGVLSGVALTDRPDTVLLLSDNGLKLCHWNHRQIEHFVDVEPDLPDNRCNDWGVDTKGRLWFGTMQNNLPRAGDAPPMGSKGSVYCLCGQKLSQRASGLGIPNSLLWSPDGQFFYVADSLESVIYRYRFDGEKLSDKQIFSAIESSGVPDGSAQDAQGNIWNCRWGAAAVFVFAADGTLMRKIPLPSLQVTSCTFAGPEMTTLYVTTARHHLTPAQQAEYPLAGSIFKLETEIQGTTRRRVELIS